MTKIFNSNRRILALSRIDSSDSSMAVLQEPSGTSHEKDAYKFYEMALGAGFALRTN
jgi:hypothetical protein